MKGQVLSQSHLLGKVCQITSLAEQGLLHWLVSLVFLISATSQNQSQCWKTPTAYNINRFMIANIEKFNNTCPQILNVTLILNLTCAVLQIHIAMFFYSHQAPWYLARNTNVNWILFLSEYKIFLKIQMTKKIFGWMESEEITHINKLWLSKNARLTIHIIIYLRSRIPIEEFFLPWKQRQPMSHFRRQSINGFSSLT